MSDKKEIKEIDVASLDSELAAARTLEEGKGDKFIMMASVVAFLMTSFHIYTGFFGLFAARRASGLRPHADPAHPASL